MLSENSSNNWAIEAHGLSKRYEIFERPADRLKQPLLNRARRWLGKEPKAYSRDFWALQNATFNIKRGETVGIIGRNGSGKSTLLQMVCGILRPTQGQLKIHGKIAALLELGAGFNPLFTGRENVYMNGAIFGLDKRAIDQRFAAIAEFADIGDFIDQPVNTYSSGMYVRLAFAVMVHVDADILVIDEALSVGDVFFTQKCMRFLRKFQETGTILFVSHDAGAVRNLCQRAIWIDHGQVQEVGDAAQVCEHYFASQYGSEATQENGENAPVPISDEIPEKTLEKIPEVAPNIGLAPNQQVHKIDAERETRDMRQDFINASNLRNDLEVFQFTEPERFFGTGAAHITRVLLCDSEGQTLSWVVGGENVEMRIQTKLKTNVKRLIMGFFFKDRLGQVLFGDNTHLSYFDTPINGAAGDTFEAYFAFRMPILPRGVYTADVTVAAGTQEEHTPLHWIHDALVLESHNSLVASGLVGVPFKKILITQLEISI